MVSANDTREPSTTTRSISEAIREASSLTLDDMLNEILSYLVIETGGFQQRVVTRVRLSLKIFQAIARRNDLGVRASPRALSRVGDKRSNGGSLRASPLH